MPPIIPAKRDCNKHNDIKFACITNFHINSSKGHRQASLKNVHVVDSLVFKFLVISAVRLWQIYLHAKSQNRIGSKYLNLIAIKFNLSNIGW